MKEIHFIINPQAKNGLCRKIWADLERELQKLTVPYQAFFTQYRGNGTEIAQALADNDSEETMLIVAVGGDGTLHEVVNGVVNCPNVVIGFIPAGSGNDFSRGYGVPKDPVEALNMILERNRLIPSLVDIGQVLHQEKKQVFFINNMGAGFDALVAKKANQSLVKGFLNRFSLGSVVYAFFLIKELFTYRCTSIEMIIDGKKTYFRDTWFVTVSNQPYYGGGMKIAPYASFDDGVLDITVVHELPKWKLLLVFITVFWGGHLSFKEVKNFHAQKISIHAHGPIDVHADGEYIGSTPIDIYVLKRILPILRERV